MAKKDKVEEVETKVEEAPLYIPEEGKQPSLNQLAIVLGIPAVRLQSAQVAYKPIEGEPYTAKKINWQSVSAFIARRLDKTGFSSVEEVYAAALSTEYTPKRATRAKDPNSVYGKVLFGTTPLRKGHLAVGDKIHNRKTDETDIVVYVDDTIVVFQPEHVDGEQVLSNSIGNRMFNMNYDIVKAD
jgi:hypothetical protein